MKLGYSTNAYTKKSLSYAIKSISQIGFDGIELVLDFPHAFLPLKKFSIEQIKTNLQKHKMQVANLNVNTVLGWHKEKSHSNKFEPSLSNLNSKLRNWRLYYTKMAIDLAQQLDSTSICLASGQIKNGDKRQSMQFFAESIEELAIYAEQKDIKIGIEYEPGLVIGSANDAFTIIRKDFKNLGLNLDICHAVVLGENISEIIKKFNTKIFHTHISDCKNKVHFHLIPGLGDIDFEKFLRELTRIGYNGYLTAELYPYNDKPEYAGKQAFNFLKKFVN